jgi:hypothetical protein
MNHKDNQTWFVPLVQQQECTPAGATLLTLMFFTRAAILHVSVCDMDLVGLSGYCGLPNPIGCATSW